MSEFRVANDPLTAGSLKVFWLDFIGNTGLESGSVIYFQYWDDNISRWLGLSMEGLDGSSSDGSAGEQCSSYLVIRFHGYSLIVRWYLSRRRYRREPMQSYNEEQAA